MFLTSKKNAAFHDIDSRNPPMPQNQITMEKKETEHLFINYYCWHRLNIVHWLAYLFFRYFCFSCFFFFFNLKSDRVRFWNHHHPHLLLSILWLFFYWWTVIKANDILFTKNKKKKRKEKNHDLTANKCYFRIFCAAVFIATPDSSLKSAWQQQIG